MVLLVPRKNWLTQVQAQAGKTVGFLQDRLRAAGLDAPLAAKIARAFEGTGVFPPDILAQAQRDELANYLAIERWGNGLLKSSGSPSSVVLAPNNSANKSRADVVLSGINDQTVIAQYLAGTAGINSTVWLLDGTVNVTATLTIPSGVILRGMGATATAIAAPFANPPVPVVNLTGIGGQLLDMSVNPGGAGPVVKLDTTSSQCLLRGLVVNSSLAQWGIEDRGLQNMMTELNIPGGLISLREYGQQAVVMSSFMGGVTCVQTEVGASFNVYTGLLLLFGSGNGVRLVGGDHQSFSSCTIGTSISPTSSSVDITGGATVGSSFIGNYFSTTAGAHAVQIDAGAAGHTVAYNNMKGWGAAAILDNGTGDTVAPNVT